jgi:hypothetical protein
MPGKISNTCLGKNFIWQCMVLGAMHFFQRKTPHKPLLAHREVYRDGGANSNSRINRHHAPMRAHNRLYYRQPEPRALATRGAASIKARKQMRQFIGSDTGTGVADSDPQVIIATAISQQNLTLGLTMPNRIVNNIHQGLYHSVGINGKNQ